MVKLVLASSLAAVFATTARAQYDYIQNVTPAPTAVGVQETITGINFGSTQGSSTVNFNTATATVYRWNSNQITVAVPNVTGAVSVTVTVNGHRSNAFQITVQPDPTITSVSPTSGPIGTVVTISGTHFGAAYGGYDAIYFGNTRAAPTSWSDTQIVVPVPTGTPGGNLSLFVEIGIGSLIYGMSVPFHVMGTSSVAVSSSPNPAAYGAAVTLTATVTPSTATGTVTFLDGSTLINTATLSGGIASLNVGGFAVGTHSITASYSGDSNDTASTSAPLSQTIITPPSITSLSPSAAPVGASVTISGNAFGASQGNGSVTFNGTPASAPSWGATSITATVPGGATSGNVVVTVQGVASNGVNFTVQPSISGVSPASGYVGTSVVISGAGFGGAQGGSTVAFNGSVAVPTSWSATSITAPVPIGAISGNVVVTVNGVASNGLTFTVLHSNLLIGSSSGDSSNSTFESYDDSGVRLQQGNLDTSRSQHTATLLKNGTVFVAGGVEAPGTWEILSPNGQLLSSGTLLNGFYGHFAVLLANGNVFLGGGTTTPGTWEIRSPSGAFVSTGSLLGARTPGAGALLLQNGNIWIVGAAPGPPGVGSSDYCSWEIRASDGSLVTNGNFATCFGSRQVSTLSNGSIIFLGGVDTPGQYDIYSQSAALIRSGTLSDSFDGNAGSALIGNNILLLEHGYWEYLGFDANANTTFDTVGSLFDQVQSSGVVVTSTGKVFITGGDASPGSWQMYTPSGTTITLSNSGSLFDTRGGGHTITHF